MPHDNQITFPLIFLLRRTGGFPITLFVPKIPMKTTPFLALFPLLGTVAFGATVSNFEGGPGDTPINLQQFGDPAGPSILPDGGNPGGFLQLTPNANGQNNFATFDLSDPGANFTASVFTFQFRVDMLGAGGADGFSFNYYPTALYGTTGGFAAPPFTPEDPAAAGVLGFGFDTWGNGDPFDANANSADYSEISLFFDGALISRIDDTRLLPTFLDLKDGAWHTVNGVVDTVGASVSMDVDGNPIFTAVGVPGLIAAEARVGFAGRTGGANEQASIDNVNVQFVPEPGVIGALAVGSLVLLRRRRR